MAFIPTSSFDEIIKFNLKDRIAKVCKIYAWLEDNNTPSVEVKLRVFDNCIFNFIVYGVETWREHRMYWRRTTYR